MKTRTESFELDMFRYNLAKYLESHSYSVRQMAMITDIPIPTFSRYANGEVPVSVKALVQLSKTMGVSVDWLLGLTETRLSDISEHDKKLINTYSIATDTDKKIIDTIIEKY